MPSEAFKAAQAKLSETWSPELETRILQTLRSDGEESVGDHGAPMQQSGKESRFALEDSSRWLAHLEERGFVVVAGVLDSGAVTHAKDLLWEYLERQGISRVRERVRLDR